MNITIKIFSLILLMSCFSCDIQKKAIKTKEATQKQNDIVKQSVKVTEEKRPGGKIKTSILPEKDREKDENGNFKQFIQELRDGALTKTIYYKQDGGVDIDCTSDEIWKRIEERLQERDNSKINTQVTEKKREKEETFKTAVIPFVILGLGIIFLIWKVFSRKK